MYFPHIDGDIEQPFLARTDIPIVKGSGTVLLVEDETDLRLLTQELLESEGYKVLSADDGQKALEHSAKRAGSIDLVLTDVVLPGMSGREIANRVAETRPDVNVLYMSGYTGALIAKQGVLEPGTALLPKPFTKRELGTDQVDAGSVTGRSWIGSVMHLSSLGNRQ